MSTPNAAGSLNGRRVVVTGADGFIGSHLVEHLVRLGADVRALCLYNSFGSCGWLDDVDASVRASIEVWAGDIRDAAQMFGLVAGADTVFHLAALISVPYSYEAPASFVATNINGTLNLLEAVRRHDVRRMVHTSTSEVYGTPDTVPITETHPLKAQSPYAASKIAADKLCESFAASFDTPVVVLRPFNTYGPRQSMRAVIPTVLRQLLEPGATVRVGTLDTRRDFTFVTDTARGFAAAATADLAAGEVVQLGKGSCHSVADIIEAAGRLFRVEPTVVTETERLRPAASEVQVLLSDPGKANERMGWQPTVTLDDGLAETAQWLEKYIDRYPDPNRYHR